ncbi:hypothetical protein [Emticicia sp. C21]|uniref:hypothetical protein n=1 Tax=Emticicia sp. C21 TaxID=2302915 RepID=UPI000E351FE4|nr:hypothetical protein [Emticicia sp. C21]RFS16824.1 hypothetical protein D0T08_09080 [Emticicia sp. C21]
MLKNLLLLNFFLVCTFVLTDTYAQKESRLTGNSPYSALGIGDINSPGAIASDAMGGTGLTFGNGIYVNTLNPAMLVKTRFVAFNTGIRGQYRTISDGTNSQTDFGANLSHIMMAFPLKPKWTMSIGLRPHSSVEHEARYTAPIQGTTNTVQYIYKGQGGFSKASVGSGHMIGKSLYVGAEGYYYFGSVSRDTTSRLLLNDGEDYYLQYRDRINANGFGLKTGFTWNQKISKKWFLNVGGTYELQSKLKGSQLRSLTTLIEGQNGPTILKKPDTLSMGTGGLTLPSSYTLGISLESPLKWIFAAEYSKQDWAQYRNFQGRAESNLTGSEKISIGVEFLPKVTSTAYFDQVFYRIGFQQIKTPYLINSTQVMDRSFTLGLSTPLGFRNLSYIDWGFAIGTRGVTGNGLIKENYFKVSLGFSLVDTRWFIKPRVD